VCVAKKGESIATLSLACEALATSSLISISASPHLNTSPSLSAYLDTPTQLPDRAMRPQISPEDEAIYRWFRHADALIYISPRGTGTKSSHVSCLLIALFGAAIVGQSKSCRATSLAEDRLRYRTCRPVCQYLYRGCASFVMAEEDEEVRWGC
jgi:hypothetical protein